MTPDAWDGLDESGTHSYLFMHLVEGRSVRQVVNALRASMPDADPGDELAELVGPWTERGWRALAAGEFVGPYAGFAHLRADGDLADLQDFVARLAHDLGIRSDHAVAGPSYKDAHGKVAMAKFKRCEVVALVSIRAEKGRTLEVLQSLGDQMGETFKGATVTYGRFDILLELGASELAPVAEAALGRLQTIDGVARTETAFSDFRRYD